MSRSRLSYILIGIIIILPITFYSVFDRSFDESKHDLGTRALNSMRRYDRLLNENLIKVNSSIIFSYDNVVEMVDSIEAKEKELKSNDLLLTHNKNNGFADEFDKIVALHQEKFSEIEKFKMNYSVFRNSLHALPDLAEDLNVKSVNSDIKLKFSSIVNYTLRYNNSPDEVQKKALLFMIDSLFQNTNYEQNANEKRAVKLFLYHAKNILELRQKNSEILNVILSYDTDYSIENLTQKYNDLYKQKNTKNRSLIFLLAVAAALLFIFIVFILLKLDKKGKELEVLNDDLDNQVKERTLELTQRNKQITDSINYAKRIQSAIVPKIEDIRKDISRTSMLYLPKDVLSGDFPYFFKNKGYMYYAAVDCTGHGVPGAMLSLIGYLLLNDILSDDVVLEPGEVLIELHKRVVSTLQQDQLGSSADGMDVALCRVKEGSNELLYAGAHRPLYLLRDGEIKVYKGAGFPIGGVQYKGKNNYPTHKIEVQTDDSIFFYSDGYPDQFGGEKNMKFGNKRLRKILEESSDKDIETIISKDLQNEFISWQGEETQIDDVLFIGMKFDQNWFSNKA